ncbi:MAG: TM2 domain-containing protein [Bacilli bacterium]
MNKFCPNCGTEIKDGAQVCLNCGKLFTSANTEAKSKLAAGLLGIFLGAWGIHNFYLGNTGRAITQIILTLVTCGIAGLWGFIEGILILTGSINTDSNGNPLRD